MTNRIWILGASDPEMERVESVLVMCGEKFVHATCRGERVTSATAYSDECVWEDPIQLTPPRWDEVVVAVECTPRRADSKYAQITTIYLDHHRPGDWGYGVHPREFLRGSSLGQLLILLAQQRAFPEELPAEWRELPKYWNSGHLHSHTHDDPAGTLIYCRQWVETDGNCGCDGAFGDHCWILSLGDKRWVQIPTHIVHAAAADHCLRAAYCGECPGVIPSLFGEWRLATRAAHQGRTVDTVRADMERATQAVLDAGVIALDDENLQYECFDSQLCISDIVADPDLAPRDAIVADFRGEEIPELSEAACRLGIAYLATPKPSPDGRRKVVLQCASPRHLAAWPAWAEENGIVDCYGGDPARGFAGGYYADR